MEAKRAKLEAQVRILRSNKLSFYLTHFSTTLLYYFLELPWFWFWKMKTEVLMI